MMHCNCTNCQSGLKYNLIDIVIGVHPFCERRFHIYWGNVHSLTQRDKPDWKEWKIGTYIRDLKPSFGWQASQTWDYSKQHNYKWGLQWSIKICVGKSTKKIKKMPWIFPWIPKFWYNLYSIPKITWAFTFYFTFYLTCILKPV